MPYLNSLKRTIYKMRNNDKMFNIIYSYRYFTNSLLLRDTVQLCIILEMSRAL